MGWRVPQSRDGYYFPRPQLNISLADIAVLTVILGATVGAIKYIVRSDVRSELELLKEKLSSIPEQIHDQVEQHMAPIERRTRVTENLTANLYGVLAGRNIVDTGEYAAAKKRFVEDSASRADGLMQRHIPFHPEGAR